MAKLIGSGDDSAKTLLIRGKRIPVRRVELAQADLRFYPENPRIYSVLNADDRAPGQEDILKYLAATDHVKRLYQEIKRDGGLTDPIIVRDGTMEVLEGNSRLAAYRLLAAKDPITWGKIRCKILPADVGDDLVVALLGQYHIRGKLQWETFEKGGFLFRRYKLHGDDIDALAKEVGIKKGEAEDWIRTYSFMMQHKDRERSHWSHYDEYLRSREIAKTRKLHPELDETFVKMVKDDESIKAMDVRTKLAKVCKHNKQLQRLLSGTPLDAAYQTLVESGAEAIAYQKVHRFNGWLSTQAAEKEILHSTGQERQRILLELRKLTRTVAKINKSVARSAEKGYSGSRRV